MSEIKIKIDSRVFSNLILYVTSDNTPSKFLCIAIKN